MIQVTTTELLALEQAALDTDLSQRISVRDLAEHLDPNGRHYLRPALVHTLSHRPDVSPQWRCEVLLAMADGKTALSLLDVLPQTFASTGSRVADGESGVDAPLASSPSVRNWLSRQRNDA
jgi:hypothetical protein